MSAPVNSVQLINMRFYNSQDLASYLRTHEFIQLASYIAVTDERRCVPSLISVFS